jgi:cytochrome c553
MNVMSSLTMCLLGSLSLVVLPAWGAGSARSELLDAMRASPNLDKGRELYGQCISCHGSDGGGSASSSVPRIAGQHYRVLLKQLVDFRLGKRRDIRMEARADQHHLQGAQDIADVALFVASQDRGGTRGIGPGEFTEQGARLYVARCQGCHGAEGQGDDSKSIPRLAGQHYGYLMRQMYDAVDGRRPTMPRTHSPRISNMDFAEVRGVADFLSRLGPRADAAGQRPVAGTAP